PLREGCPGRVERPFRLPPVSSGDAPDHLRLVARIQALRPGPRADPLTADDQGPFAIEFRLDVPQRGLHRLALRGVREIREGFVDKLGNHGRTLACRQRRGRYTAPGPRPCRADATLNDLARVWLGRTW